jgi:phage portal protein BeeE
VTPPDVIHTGRPLGRVYGSVGRTVRRDGGIDDVAMHFARARAQAGGTMGGPSDPYAQVVAVFRCVQFLAEGVAGLPLRVSAGDEVLEGGPILDLLDRPNALHTTEEWLYQTVGWLVLGGIVHWVLDPPGGGTGNTPGDGGATPGSGGGGLPGAILPVGAPQMRPRTEGGNGSDRGALIGWRYRPAGASWSEAIDLELSEVWTLRIPGFDADRPWAGASVLDVCRRAVAQLWKSDVANESGLDNGVEPSGALSTDQSLTDAQRTQLRRAIEEHHAGAANRKRLLLLEGGLSWQAIQSSFADMEFSTLKRFSRDDVCAAFGLDPSVVGFPPEGGRFEYAKQAAANAWIGRVIPLANQIAGALDRAVLRGVGSSRSYAVGDWLPGGRSYVGRSMRAAERMARRMTSRGVARKGSWGGSRGNTPRDGGATGGATLRAWFDVSVVEAVRELIASRVETAGRMVRELKAAPGDVIDLFDLGLEIHPWQQTGWQTISEMPITPGSDGTEQGDEPGGAPDAETDPETDPGIAEGGDEAVVQESVGRRSGLPIRGRGPTEDQYARLWQAWRRSWMGLQNRVRHQLRQHLFALQRECLANLRAEQAPPPMGAADAEQVDVRVEFSDLACEPPAMCRATHRMPAVRRDVIDRVLFDLLAADGRLVASVGPVLREAVRLGGQQTMDEAAAAEGADEPTPFNTGAPEAQAALRRRTIRIKGVNTRAAQRLRAQLAEGLAAGETHDALAERIKHQFALERGRDRLIAFQEVSTAVEESRHIARVQAGVPMKSWLWSRKETGRQWHMLTEQATRDEPIAATAEFVISQTGNTCLHPRNTGDPRDDIHCGCTTLSRYPDDNRNARMFAHLARAGFTCDTEVARRMHDQDGDA